MRLIDADKLKRRVQSVATEAWKLKLEAKVETTLNQFLDYVEQSPTIDAVSVVRGEWIDKGRHLWECSNCKMMIYSESEQDRSEFHKWCSRCGASMDGERNDND